jgi:HD-GYP domain-containing protein (c-di-GMP phosphodiesterase class II)
VKLGTTAAGLALAAALLPAGAAAADGTSSRTLERTTSAPTTTSVTTNSATDTSTSNGQAGGQTSGGSPSANVPVNQGTTKKLASTTQQTSSTAPTTTSDTAPTSSSTSRVSRTRRATSSGRATTTRRSRATSSARTGGSHRASRTRAAAPTGGSSAQPDRTGGVTGSAAGSAAARRAKGAQHASSADGTGTTGSKRTTPVTGLDSINRAADRVIEVIPGLVLLALAILGGLVVMLVARSLVIERRRNAALRASYGVTVQALATAIEAKDHTTGGHIERVRELGLLLARRLVPREAKDPQMAFGFLLHDIGKLAIPDAILRKTGRLTEQEWALMRRHPEEGVRILASIPFLGRALDVVRHHHERWDGGGYPDGLAGEEIPLWARIFAVVDAVDAITAERPYRQRRPYEEALDEIRSHAGTQFDPVVVDALEAIDASEVERLLEPAQVLDRVTGAELAELEPLEAILAATEAARVDAGDVAPAPEPATA